MVSITEQRKVITTNAIEDLEKLFTDAGIEFFRTGANLSTLTYEVGEVEGKPVYGSIKFTLHKSNYNLDDEIEEFEMLLEERRRKEVDRAAKKAKEAKDRAERERKAAERQEAETRRKEQRRANLADDHN